MHVRLTGIISENTEQCHVTATDITERKQAEENLLGTAMKLARSQKIGKLGNWEWNIVENSLEWSDEVYRIWGVGKDFALTFESIDQMIHPDDREFNFKMVQEFLPDTNNGEFEFRIICPDGTIKNIYQSIETSHAPSGQPLRMFGIMQDITGRKLGEEVLKQSEARLNAILSSMNDIVLEIDLNNCFDGHFAPKNKTLYVHPDLFIGKKFDEILPEDVCVLLHQAIESINSGNPFQEFEYHLTIDNTIQWEHAVITPRYNNSNEYVGITAVCRDITERKLGELLLQEKTEEIEVQNEEYQQINEELYRAKEKAEEKEKQLQTLFDNISDGIGISKSGISCFINNSYLKMFGYENADEIIGKSLLEQISPKEHEKVRHFIANRYTDTNLPKHYETIGIKKNGQEFPLELFVGTYQLNKEHYSFGILRDITQRKQIKKELISAKEKAEKNEEKFRNAIENSPIPTAIVDNDGKVTYLNKQFVQTYGYTLQEIPSMEEWFVKAYPDAHYRSFVLNDWGKEVEQSTANDVPTGYKEYLVTCKSGEIKTVSVSTFFEKDIAVGLFHDITERKRAEEALKESVLDLEIRNNFINTILENLAIGFSVHFIDSGVTEYINPAYSRVYGWPAEDMKDVESFFKLIYPDPVYSAQQMKMVMEDINSGDPERMHWEGFMITTKTGEERFIEARNIPLPDQNLMISTAWDITERKLAEEALIIRNQAFEDSIAAQSIADCTANITHVNKAFMRMWGYTSEEQVIGKSIGSFFYDHTDAVPVVEALASHDKWEGEFLAKRTDGTTFISRGFASSLRNTRGELIGYQSTNLDVTREREAEAALQESDQRFMSVLQASRDAILLVDCETIVDCNEAAVQMLGYLDRDAILKTHPSELSPPTQPDGKDSFEKANDMMKAAYKNGANQFEWIHRKANGDAFPVEVTLTSIMSNGKNVLHSVWHDITERKRAEEKLRESGERLSLATRAGGVGIWDYDIVNNKMIWDAQMYRLYGITRDTYEGADEVWRTVVHPEEMQRVDDEIQMALRGEKEFDSEFRVLWQDGTIRNIRALSTIQRDSSGMPLRMIGTNWDITEDKRAEEALRQSEEKLQSILINMTDVVWSISWPDLTHNYISPSFEKLYGRSKQEHMDNPSLFIEVTHPDDQHLTEKAMKQLAEEGKAERECRIIKPDGSIVWINDRSKMIYDENHQPIKVEGVTRDITERKLVEEVIQKNHKRLDLAMQTANMAWWEMDIVTGNVTFNNRKAEMLGYLPEQFAHYKDFTALVHPEDYEKAMDAMRKHLSGLADRYEVEYRILTKSGDYKWFYDTGSIVNKDSDGKPLKVTGLVIDITERKRREEQNAKMLSMQQSLNTLMLEQHRIDDYEQLIKTVVTQIDQLFSPIASVFNEYDQNARVLRIKGFKVNQYILNLFVKIGGMRILSRVTPVNEDMYKEIKSERVKIVSSMYDAFGGAVSKTVTSKLEKALKIKSYIGFSHILNDQVFGTTVIALEEEPEDFVIEFMKNYAHYISISLQRVLALQALRESEARFHMAMHAASEGIWDWNVSTNEYYYSPGFFRMLGYEFEEFPAEINIWKQLMHPNDKENALEATQQCVDGSKESFEAVFRMKTKEGKWRWIMGRGSAVLRDGNGKALRMTGTHVDITRIVETEQELKQFKESLEKLVKERTEKLSEEAMLRTQAEMDLRESEARYRGIVDYSTSIILEWDANGTVLFLNRYGQEFFGFTSGEITGKNVVGTIVDPLDSAGIDHKSKMDVLQKEPEQFYSSENENITKSGDRVWVAWTNKGIYNEEGELIKTLSIGIDRTIQRKLEESLYTSAEYIRQSNESGLAGALENAVKGRTQHLTEVNRRLTEEMAKKEQDEKELFRTKESFIKFSRYLQKIREEERAAVALDIHDHLGQSLTALLIDLNHAYNEAPGDTRMQKRYRVMKELVSGAISDVQRISAGLRPALLDDIGLSAAIEHQCQEFEARTGIKCNVRLDDFQFEEKEINLAIFRIVQESLTNVARHSEANSVTIDYCIIERSVMLDIVDDGKGMDKKIIDDINSLGIMGIKERVAQCKGEVSITSDHMKGTRVSVVLPMKQNITTDN